MEENEHAGTSCFELGTRTSARRAGQRGAPFAVIATTTRPDGCWHPGGYEEETGASDAAMIAYDYRKDSEICTLIFSWTTREVELQCDHPGEASIRLVGRRIARENFGGGEKMVIEHPLTVRCSCRTGVRAPLRRDRRVTP